MEVKVRRRMVTPDTIAAIQKDRQNGMGWKALKEKHHVATSTIHRALSGLKNPSNGHSKNGTHSAEAKVALANLALARAAQDGSFKSKFLPMVAHELTRLGYSKVCFDLTAGKVELQRTQIDNITIGKAK